MDGLYLPTHLTTYRIKCDGHIFIRYIGKGRNSMAEYLLCMQKTPSSSRTSPGCWTGTERKCGHSMVFWAARRAAKLSMGSQLGLSRWAAVQWLGRRGMHWEGLLPALFRQGLVQTIPQVLVIHLGGNDLGLMKGKALIIQASKDMQAIRQRWPWVRLMWSDLLPRKVWCDVWDLAGVDRVRKKVNRQIRLALLGQGGLVIPHPQIQQQKGELYRADGIHCQTQVTTYFWETCRDVCERCFSAVG
ncbi:uncharacterized protein LOC133388738 isoform X2 [Rhineura floridana]|uniref:uncharacterized protein LOC133388738 isoform X2 n=1 Tax=Rhineura floridana TaxID=261503 RepID=UPI002AC88843|nr:uncharacterized protein LOC133388738 isoform X2 [Rhineura floridana]